MQHTTATECTTTNACSPEDRSLQSRNAETNGAKEKQAAPRRRVVSPTYRTSSDGDSVTLQVEVPGVAPEGLTLFVEDGVLQLEAGQSLTLADDGALRQALEFQLGDYRGRWRLPENVDVEAITTKLQHGVLELVMPLKKPTRHTLAIR